MKGQIRSLVPLPLSFCRCGAWGFAASYDRRVKRPGLQPKSHIGKNLGGVVLVCSKLMFFGLFGLVVGYLLIPSFAWAGEVIKVNAKKKRIVVLMSDSEKNIYKKGDRLQGRNELNAAEFSGVIVNLNKFELVIAVRKRDRLPRQGDQLILIPRYRNKYEKDGFGFRDKSGFNLWGERFFLLGQLGNGLVTDMIFYGIRGGMYIDSNLAFSLGYVSAALQNNLAIVSSSMATLRCDYFWGFSFSLHGGLTMRDTAVVPLLQVNAEGELIASDETTAEAQKDPDFASLHNQYRDYLLDIGASHLFTLDANLVGHVLLVGFDWLTVQLRLATDYNPNPPSEYLEWAFSADKAVTYHSRFFLGVSF